MRRIFSPFGIDWLSRSDDGDGRLSRSYEVLAQLAPLVLENQPEGRVPGVLLDEATPSQKLQLGDHILDASAIQPWQNGPTRPEFPEESVVAVPYGIFIATGRDEFYMAGDGLTIRFSPSSPGHPLAGLATVEEGRFVHGRWHPGRTLAGDDTDQGNSVSLRAGRGPGILRVVLYRYR